MQTIFELVITHSERLFLAVGFPAVATALAAAYLAFSVPLLVAGFFSDKTAEKDKTWCLVVLLLVFLLQLAAAAWETALNGSPFVGGRLKKLLLPSALDFSCACVCAALLFLRPSVGLTPKEKKIVDRLIGGQPEVSSGFPSEELPPSAVPRAFSAAGCVRRIEKIQTYKPIDDLSDNIDRLNYAKILSYISSLSRCNLSFVEKDEIEKLSEDVRKFSVRRPTDYERSVLSGRLLSLVKMLVKYDVS